MKFLTFICPSLTFLLVLTGVSHAGVWKTLSTEVWQHKPPPGNSMKYPLPCHWHLWDSIIFSAAVKYRLLVFTWLWHLVQNCLTDYLNMNGGNSSAEHARSAAKTTEKSAQINASGIPGKKIECSDFLYKVILCFQCKHILKFLLYKE